MRFIHLADSVADADYVFGWLRREMPGCVGRHVATREEFSAAMQSDDFDVVLSDFTPAEFDRMWALALTRKKHPDIPFIFIAGSIGEDQVVELILNGATDYVHRDRMERLVPALKQALWGLENPERRSQKDEALRKAEARIREQAALLDKAQDAIIVQNLGGLITFWNKGAEHVYGWSAEEMIGKDEVSLQAMEPLRHRFALEHTLAHGEWRGELRHKQKSGAEVIVQSRWTLVRDDADTPSAVLIINTDVTDNRMLETKFLRAQRLESMGMLVGGIAHDLNNVLAPILMSVDLLRKMVAVEVPEAVKLIQTMHRSVKHGSALVQQLLAFARGAEGRHVELDLQPLLSEFVEFMAQTLAENISLELTFKQPPMPVLADATQLNQVLMNLCINARDAMPSGGRINITIDGVVIDEAQAHLLPEGCPGEYMVISVADTGDGIPPEMLERIFDPFFTTKETGQGTGLGLSTVRGIIKGHSGFLTVESESKQGTTFRIYLPVHNVAVGKSAQPELSAPAILLVDEEDMVRNALTLLLKSEGYFVFAYASGEEALLLLKSGRDRIDLLMTELRPTDSAGFDLIATTRELRPSLPIIALTDMSVDKQENHDIIPGVRLLSKPMTRPTLMKAVEEVLTAVV